MAGIGAGPQSEQRPNSGFKLGFKDDAGGGIDFRNPTLSAVRQPRRRYGNRLIGSQIVEGAGRGPRSVGDVLRFKLIDPAIGKRREIGGSARVHLPLSASARPEERHRRK